MITLSRRLAFSVAILAPMAAGPAFAAEETRSVSAFTAVQFGGAGEVAIAVGKDQSVVLEGDKELLERVTTEVHDGALQIKRENRHWWESFFGSDNRKLKVGITLPHLTAASAAGAAKMSATGIEGDAVAFSIAGAGELQADGHVEKVVLSIAGSGEADLDRLAAADAVVSITGAGSVHLQTKDQLKASITGAGRIRYAGDPHVTSNITGEGSIKRE